VVKKVRKTRRGQTIFLALAILFLLILLGTIFVTSLIRNLHRASRHGGTDEALTLALAGLQYAANQFRGSELGADWRPRPIEALWSTPKATNFKPFPVAAGNPLDANNNGLLEASELQQFDPDYHWLSDNGTFQQPFVRIPTGRGRFLLRVSYVPRFRLVSTGVANQTPQEFDRGSGMIHVECIGRPGEYAPDDPTFFGDPTTIRNGTEIVGQFRKIDAYVPVGLVDQLWWSPTRPMSPVPRTSAFRPSRPLPGPRRAAPAPSRRCSRPATSTAAAASGATGAYGSTARTSSGSTPLAARA